MQLADIPSREVITQQVAWQYDCSTLWLYECRYWQCQRFDCGSKGHFRKECLVTLFLVI
jgi:hypothetical protein